MLPVPVVELRAVLSVSRLNLDTVGSAHDHCCYPFVENGL